MAIEVDELIIDVQPEAPAPPTAPPATRSKPAQAARTRALLRRLRRDEARTRAEGFDD